MLRTFCNLTYESLACRWRCPTSAGARRQHNRAADPSNLNSHLSRLEDAVEPCHELRSTFFWKLLSFRK